MIQSVTFHREHRGFARGKKFTFKPGWNLLVGENGSGKSTLISACREPGRFDEKGAWTATRDDDGPTIAWDAEKDNLRTQSWFDEDIALHVMSMKASHGQAAAARLNKLFEPYQDANHTPGVILLDEPDSGLSLRNVAALGRLLNAATTIGWQVIVATHHPDLIAAAGTVMDLDRGGRRVKAATYLTAAREAANLAPTGA